jgi:hypothetical protein
MNMTVASEESVITRDLQSSVEDVDAASEISGANASSAMMEICVAGVGDESITEERVERAKDELIRSLDEERNYLRREMQLIVTRDKLMKKIQAAEMQETLKKLSAQSQQLETIRRSVM